MTGKAIKVDKNIIEDSRYLPIHNTLHTTDKQPAFRIIGYEDVDKLNNEMGKTQIVTISGFLVLSLISLMFALWLFNRFLFIPLNQMIYHMKQMAQGRLDLNVNKKGLREFNILAETFNSMANQIRQRNNDLERLLDLDDSAIVCFGKDNEAVYFNKSATDLFGYNLDEIIELDLSDLFVDDVQELMTSNNNENEPVQLKCYALLTCVNKDGQEFQCEAVISVLDDRSVAGYAIILRPVAQDAISINNESDNEQRMDVIE